MASMLFTFIASIAIVLLYFSPYIYAKHRGHRHASAILALVLLTGWTGLGWIIAVIWSEMDQTNKSK